MSEQKSGNGNVSSVKLAKMEAAIENLTTLTHDIVATVSSQNTRLSDAIQKQGEKLTEQIEQVVAQIQSLTLSVVQVGAPKQANWFALIGTSVSLTLLMVTLGGLVLLPMTKETTKLEAWREKHSDLDLHPKGQVRLDALEKVVTERAFVNAAGIRDLDAKLQKEYQLIDESIRNRVGAVERELRERWVVDSAGLEKIADKTEKTLNRIAMLETIVQRNLEKKP